MRDGQAFHQVDGKLFGDVRENALLLIKCLLVGADQTTLLVDDKSS